MWSKGRVRIQRRVDPLVRGNRGGTSGYKTPERMPPRFLGKKHIAEVTSSAAYKKSMISAVCFIIGGSARHGPEPGKAESALFEAREVRPADPRPP